MSDNKILLGFKSPSGEPFYLKLHHLVITGMTQLSGKTTAIEALISRSGLRAVVFKTKRGEAGFETAGKNLPLYFKERSDWRYVSSLIEATLREKVKFERSWVIRACKGTRSLREVYNRVVSFLEGKRLRALDRSVFTNLQAYLDLILPEIERLPVTDKITIGPGVNVMDLEEIYHRPEVQALIIRSVMEHILEKERQVLIVVPECWKFLPQGRNTPVKLFFERFIREGAAIGNYLWLDSQDIAGVDKAPLRQVDNWILGRQREAHEVERTVEAIPLPKSQKPTTLEIRRLKLGHFYAACGDQVSLVYVLPAGIPEDTGRQIAAGKLHPEHVKEMLEKLRSRKESDEELVWKEKYEELLPKYNEAQRKLGDLLSQIGKETDFEKNLREKNKQLTAEIEKLKADYAKANDQLTTILKDRNNRLREIRELQDKLEKAHRDLEIFKEFQVILARMIPTRVQVPAETRLGPTEINVTAEQPAISVKVERVPLTLTDKDLEGRIAILYAKGELPQGWFSSGTIYKLFNSHGWPQNPQTSKALDKFCRWGYLAKKMSGRRPDYRVKMDPREASEKGLLKVVEA